MTDEIQIDYETRVEKLAEAFHTFDGIGSQLTIYHLLIEQYRRKGDRLFQIEPLLYVFIKSLETSLHISLARVLEPKKRSHGNIEKFLSFCKGNASKIRWEQGQLTADLIEAQERELAKHARVIEAIQTRRDKRFAHTDRLYFENSAQVMDDHPLGEADFVNLANCIVSILNTHANGLASGRIDIGMHIFNEIAVDNMVRNLEAGRRINFPGQLD